MLRLVWRASIAGAVVVVTAFTSALFLVRDARLHTAIDRDVAAAVMLGVALVMFGSAARTRPDNRRLARAWTLLGFAYIAYFLGEALWATVGVTPEDPPWSFVSLGLYLAFYPLFALGVLGPPRLALSRGERRKVVLDIGIVTLAAGIILWTLVTKPAVLAVHPQHLRVVLSILYPLGDLALLWAVLTLVFSRRDPAASCVWGLLAASAGVLIFTDVGYGLELLGGENDLTGRSPSDGCRATSWRASPRRVISSP